MVGCMWSCTPGFWSVSGSSEALSVLPSRCLVSTLLMSLDKIQPLPTPLFPCLSLEECSGQTQGSGWKTAHTVHPGTLTLGT